MCEVRLADASVADTGRFQILNVYVGADGHYFGMNHPTTINPGYVVSFRPVHIFRARARAVRPHARVFSSRHGRALGPDGHSARCDEARTDHIALNLDYRA